MFRRPVKTSWRKWVLTGPKNCEALGKGRGQRGKGIWASISKGMEEERPSIFTGLPNMHLEASMGESAEAGWVAAGTSQN